MAVQEKGFTDGNHLFFFSIPARCPNITKASGLCEYLPILVRPLLTPSELRDLFNGVGISIHGISWRYQIYIYHNDVSELNLY